MAYSGTVGETVISVQYLIDHGARRCGKLAEELTSEQIVSARQSLYFLLSHLANQGINYWAINKKVFGLKADQYIYTMPVGCIDVLNVLYRSMNRPSGSYTTSAGGVIANVTTPTLIQFVNKQAPMATYLLITAPIIPFMLGLLAFYPMLLGVDRLLGRSR